MSDSYGMVCIGYVGAVGLGSNGCVDAMWQKGCVDAIAVGRCGGESEDAIMVRCLILVFIAFD